MSKKTPNAALNYCQLGGYLVSASYRIPDDPVEFFVPGTVWKRGCNRLVCRSCRRKVRNQCGIFGDDETEGRESKIYRTKDWSTLKFLDHGPGWEGHRFYACNCDTYTADDAVPVNDDTSDRLMPNWRCAGHPLAVPGGEYYGVVVKPRMNWARLVEKAFTGWKPEIVWEETLSPKQGLWLRALYGMLLGTPMAGALSRAAAKFLTHPEPMMRANSLRFFYALAGAPGAERIAELALGDRALFNGFKNPFPTDEPDLEAWLWATLGQRIAMGNVEYNGEKRAADLDELIPIARAEIVRPGKARPLIHGLAHADGKWLMEHAVEVVQSTPAVAAEILLELEEAGEEIRDVGVDVARVPGIDAAAFRKALSPILERYSYRKIREAMPK